MRDVGEWSALVVFATVRKLTPSTFATASIALGEQLQSTAFKVIGAFLATQVILHWLYVSIFTLWKLVEGGLFAAPELNGLEPRSRWRVARDIEAGYGEAEESEEEVVPMGLTGGERGGDERGDELGERERAVRTTPAVGKAVP